MSMEASDPMIRSAITQVAADWYAAHRVGPLSDTARANFLAWLKASPMHI
jgi:ferric-dicitrate binding protein FerR (iron transport regulator)